MTEQSKTKRVKTALAINGQRQFSGLHIKASIRTKILVSFLAVSLIAVGIISIFAVRNMGIVGNTARQNSINLGESAVAESIAALEDSGRRIIQLKAAVVARDVQVFIEQHPELSIQKLTQDEQLKKLAIQTVGQTGNTMVYDRNGIIYFNSDASLVGAKVDSVSTGIPELEPIIKSSLSGGEAAGYYDVEDNVGNVRSKYIYTVPVVGTPFIVAATTFIDEFSRPAAETESKISTAVLNTTRYIERQMDLAQWTFIVIIVCMIAIISVLASIIARTITEPIVALTRGSEIRTSGGRTGTAITV